MCIAHLTFASLIIIIIIIIITITISYVIRDKIVVAF
jgi:hypothetical protein